MHIHNLSQENSILNTYISEIRALDIQSDRMRFRMNIERIGGILGYELSKVLNYTSSTFKTPLGTSQISIPDNDLVLCSVLRAGIPLHQGLLNCFDMADSAFISAYRHHKKDSDDFTIKVEYLASPSIEGKTLVLADPMLATGKSLQATFDALKRYGTPKTIHLVCVIGARDGVNYINDTFPKDTHLWIATIDETLNAKGYIVPGLGDAGDLIFGEKLQQ
ncbi:uracil phosphoribosyltransferase [Aestuariivivens sediminis]|uniref:uracil phosphoribosyltransferase n=1 Tax=Aestuariivivens sediminis TaxID=2913557 RepID=UPI001F592560|nr:uracil phosphoribosyltransferase [Aestuariivivens sediminis]